MPPDNLYTYTQKEEFAPNDYINTLHEHNIRVDSREIFLNSWIDGGNEETGIDYRVTTQFIKNLSILESINHKDILVRMNSIGGNFDQAIGIYDALLLSPCRIAIIAYSNAHSMGSIILQAASTRILMPHTEMLIHLGTLCEDGEYQNCISGLEVAKKEAATMLQIYANRCINGKFFQQKKNVTIKGVMKYINDKIHKHGDWWLSSEEGIFYGFADQIYEKN
jgi:ATP-dependent protease ClpP protease subunit